MFVPSPLMGEGQDEGGTEQQEVKFRSSTTFALAHQPARYAYPPRNRKKNYILPIEHPTML